MKDKKFQLRLLTTLVPVLFLLASAWGPGVEAQVIPVATRAPISGEIELLSLTTPTDIYSGGTIVVGGQTVILPRNLLIDLPANRLTLQQIFAQAPAACVTAGQSGLAKGDSCNTSGTGGFATISANRTSAGNVIAGDVLIEKGREALAGIVTYISYADGFFRVNGIPDDPDTGAMVRLNDPTSRHTIQPDTGPGCLPGSPNCSPDPRFTLDPDNYTNAFSTGYPMCIPSTTSRSFTAIPGITGPASAGPDGTGDVLCPDTNRAGAVVPDSRVFAPVKVGDSVVTEGNFENIGGVRFLSSHTTRVAVALGTNTADPTQPDYLFMEEVFVDTMGFNNQRARSLFIGFSTGTTDMRIWSIHRDPTNNEIHEFPLASVAGCDAAGGGCGANGLVGGAGGNIFKIRYDIDFADPTLIAKKPELYPCASLSRDPDWAALNICGGTDGTIAQNFAVLSPTPHEIIVRSRKKTNDTTGALVTRDVNGQPATNGTYLFPLGINLGGLETPEFVEIDLGALNTPWLFTGVPWNLDRRLGPGGCQNGTGCEGGGPGSAGALAFALDPFPFEGLDPRTNEPTLISGVGSGAFNDPNYTASVLNTPGIGVRNRILSYVNRTIGNFNGNSTVLPWPPANPGAIAITPTPVAIACAAGGGGGGGGGTNTPVTTNPDVRTTGLNALINIDVLTNDTGSINQATLAVTQPATGGTAVPNANGTITFTPALNFSGTVTFTYTVQDQLGTVSAPATVTVGVGVTTPPPVVTPPANLTSVIAPLCATSVPATNLAIQGFLTGATATNNVGPIINDAPADFPLGTTTVTFTAINNQGFPGSATATVTVNATPNTAPVVTPPAPITIASATPVPRSNPAIAAFLAGATVFDTGGAAGHVGPITNDAPATFPLGPTTVTFSATDSCGLTDVASSTVTIIATPVDLDIAAFTITRTVRRTLNQSVAITLRVINRGTVDDLMPATVVGVQNGIEVYRQTQLVKDPVAAGATTFTFPPFRPTAAGNITWTVEIFDQNPDVDRATRTTSVR